MLFRYLYKSMIRTSTNSIHSTSGISFKAERITKPSPKSQKKQISLVELLKIRNEWVKKDKSRFIEAILLYEDNYDLIKEYVATKSKKQIIRYSEKFNKHLTDKWNDIYSDMNPQSHTRRLKNQERLSRGYFLQTQGLH
jgi:hypothetical protein